jgi:DNA repair exonuclease SbcCD ATPase subunit
MARITLDGLEVEIPADSATAVKSFVKDTERGMAEIQQKLDAQVQEFQTATNEKTELQERVDNATGRIEELEKQLAEAVAASEQRSDADEINSAVNKRIEALNKFAAILPQDYKFDGENEAQIMALAYQNVFEKEAREDASADYLLGVLDGVLAAMEDIEEDQEEIKADAEFAPEEDGSNVAEVRAALSAVQASEKFDAQDAYRERLLNGWKSDLSANA